MYTQDDSKGRTNLFNIKNKATEDDIDRITAEHPWEHNESHITPYILTGIEQQEPNVNQISAKKSGIDS